MKHSIISMLFTASFLLMLISCQKSEIIPDDSAQEENVLKGGKPGGSSGYVLETDDTPMQIYGVWHAGNDYCTWGTKRDMAEFDSKNNWIIKGNNGSPCVNLLVLSFVNPLKLLNQITDTITLVWHSKGNDTGNC